MDFRTNLNVYLKKLGLEGLPPACYDLCYRSSQVISHMEAGVGGCTAQRAVDLAYTKIGIQLTILRKASGCDENNICRCSSNLYKHIKIRIKNIPGDWDETCALKLG